MTLEEILGILNVDQNTTVVTDMGLVSGDPETLIAFASGDVLLSKVDEISVEDGQLKIWLK